MEAAGIERGQDTTTGFVHHELTQKRAVASAHCQHLCDSSCQSMTPHDVVLQRLITIWPMLPANVRSAVEMLCLKPDTSGNS